MSRWWRRATRFRSDQVAMSLADAREHMVATQIEARGLRDPELLRAFRTVPREYAFTGYGSVS